MKYKLGEFVKVKMIFPEEFYHGCFGSCVSYRRIYNFQTNIHKIMYRVRLEFDGRIIEVDEEHLESH
jgi:hypothetical protein